MTHHLQAGAPRYLGPNPPDVTINNTFGKKAAQEMARSTKTTIYYGKNQAPTPPAGGVVVKSDRGFEVHIISGERPEMALFMQMVVEKALLIGAEKGWNADLIQFDGSPVHRLPTIQNTPKPRIDPEAEARKRYEQSGLPALEKALTEQAASGKATPGEASPAPKPNMQSWYAQERSNAKVADLQRQLTEQVSGKR